ncbi:hypothetical protein CAPTEDRAFT_206777 [Capitella teleta]|uniref:Uncharacterized protein n=1 Tax=Capitella teleta TaxID=283909 RepID=R7U652_CAPTE|nr:hypothetical protein CAPTEDRAFT_206777 [Capitella teleta]|eukprot:ELU01429.1 hypothetical protein CAPTEDRAFT_206777 [Capitella teleta]
MSDKKKPKSVSLVTFMKYGGSNEIGYVLDSEGKGKVVKIYCKICSKSSQKIRAKLTGRAYQDAEQNIVGTTCVDKFNIFHHLNGNTHKIGLEFNCLELSIESPAAIVHGPNTTTQSQGQDQVSVTLKLDELIETSVEIFLQKRRKRKCTKSNTDEEAIDLKRKKAAVEEQEEEQKEEEVMVPYDSEDDLNSEEDDEVESSETVHIDVDDIFNSETSKAAVFERDSERTTCLGHCMAKLSTGGTTWCSRSLAALDIRGDQYGVLLTPIIVSRLTPSLRKEWARRGEKREADLTFLLECLKKEVEKLDRSSTFESREDLELTQRNKVQGVGPLYRVSIVPSVRQTWTQPREMLQVNQGHGHRTEGQAAKVLLQMFSVKVQGPEGEVDAVVLLNTGSDRSFISCDLVLYVINVFSLILSFARARLCVVDMKINNGGENVHD